MKLMSLEWYKLRKKHLFMMVILFLLIEIGWAFMAAKISFSRNPENACWEAIIAMLSSMNGLFLPILTSICVSRICDMEHKGNTWILLLTASVKCSKLYAAKYIFASILLLWACIVQMIAIIAFGFSNSLDQPVPYGLIFKFLLGTMLTNMVLLALQQWVSMAVKNQAFALSLGMVGGFIGLVADMLPSGLRHFLAWSYYTLLSPIAQNYSSDKMHFIVRDISLLVPKAAMLMVFGIGIYLAGCIYVSKQKV